MLHTKAILLPGLFIAINAKDKKETREILSFMTRAQFELEVQKIDRMMELSANPENVSIDINLN